MDTNPHSVPSSSTAGFFQTPPDVQNQFHDDAALNRALMLFVPKDVLESIATDLDQFGTKVLSPKVMGWVFDAERNTPYVKNFDSWGRRRDELITTEGCRNLQALGQAEGMVAIPYENNYAEYSRVYHFAKYAIWCGSAAWVNCPSLMSDGVAALFRKHLTESVLSESEENVLRSAYDRLTSRDPAVAWTTGQWMTERQGGSDVSMTESVATYDPRQTVTAKATDGNALGPWQIDGFKWFSSATDSNMVVMLARTPKGISTFFAPMRKTLKERNVLGNGTELNGITIQRLKDKLGTRALPTAELVLKGTRAWLVGEDGRGTKEIATVLNIARIHNGATAIGLWGRGLGIVRAFTRVRVVGRRPLWERTAFMRTLARMHAEYKANVLFNFLVAGLLGVIENDISSAGQVPGLRNAAMAHNLFRLLTPALKGHCSKTAISGLQECMECLGGVGYLENEDMQFNVARLYRDANVMPIWEGTTDMMADDSILRVLHGKLREPVMNTMETWVGALLGQIRKDGGFHTQHDRVQQWWTDLKASVKWASREEAEMKSRAAMDCLVDIVQGLLLLIDAVKDGNEVAKLVAEAWFLGKYRGMTLKQDGWKSQIDADLKIVFGSHMPLSQTSKL
ncbi:acyl-CoA dehydrogenase/oxidase [Trichoderma barbatum]